MADTSTPRSAPAARLEHLTNSALVLVIPSRADERAYLARVPNTEAAFFSRISLLMDEADVNEVPVYDDVFALDTGVFVSDSPLAMSNPRARQLLEPLLGAPTDDDLAVYDHEAVRGTVVISGQFMTGVDEEFEERITDVPEDIIRAFNSEVEPVKVVEVPFVVGDLALD